MAFVQPEHVGHLGTSLGPGLVEEQHFPERSEKILGDAFHCMRIFFLEISRLKWCSFD